RLTHGWRDSEPAWSPDGRWIAFVRVEREENPSGPPRTGKPQLWILPAHGGEPRRLTDHPLGVSAPVWSPDSTRLAYLARVPEPGRYGTDEKDRKSTRLNSSHVKISYAVFCLKKKT